MNEFSCIKEVTKIIQIALPPAYVTNEISGISDLLESWKRQYVQQLDGILVSYKNVSLTSNSGFIVVEKPVVHYKVKATFELFCPTVGSIVKGKINRISREHIGCLVHNIINVTIDRPFSTSTNISSIINLDNFILFQIVSFNFQRRVIRIKGIINDECVNLMNDLSFFNTQYVVEDSISGDVTTAGSSEDSVNSEWQSQRVDRINDSVEKESASLLLPMYVNSLNNNCEISKISLNDFNQKPNPINRCMIESPISKELSSTVEESDCTSNLIKSPSKHLKKKNKKAKRKETVSAYENANTFTQDQITEKSVHKKSRFMHENLEEKLTETCETDSLVDFKSKKCSKRKKDSSRKKDALSNDTSSSNYEKISSPKSKKGTKKLYNEALSSLEVRPKLNNFETNTDSLMNAFSTSLLSNDDFRESIKNEKPVKEIEKSIEVSKSEMSDTLKLENEICETSKNVNKELQNASKGKKKRKRDSSDTSKSRKKRKKEKDGISATNVKIDVHKKKKSKKKNKEKSKKDSKKSKKLKSVDDLLKSRKKFLKKESKLK